MPKGRRPSEAPERIGVWMGAACSNETSAGITLAPKAFDCSDVPITMKWLKSSWRETDNDALSKVAPRDEARVPSAGWRNEHERIG